MTGALLERHPPRTLARRLTAVFAVAALSAFFLGRAGGQPATEGGSLKGRLLVAAEGLHDPRFARTVVLMVRHNAKGAFGLIVNRPAGDMLVADILKRHDEDIKGMSPKIAVYYGGPVRLDRGFVIHSPDYRDRKTITVNKRASVTSSSDVLESIAKGKGPKSRVFMLGHAGWAPRQLEGELLRKSWVVVPFDANIVFDKQSEKKWRRALDSRGEDL